MKIKQYNAVRAYSDILPYFKLFKIVKSLYKGCMVKYQKNQIKIIKKMS